MAKTKFPAQVYRLDGKDCFLEVMCHSLSIDKIVVNFCAYNKNLPAGQRETGKISIYLDIFEAQVLAGDILSGRMTKMAMASRKKAEEAGSKYPESIYSHLGGTAAKNTPDGKAISRQFKVTPGNAKPWVLEAVSGPGKEIGTGLISPDGKPTTTIRVATDDAKLKELAYALNMTAQIWGFSKFSPVVEPSMSEVRRRTEEAIQQRAREAGGTDNSDDGNDEFPEELPY